MVTETSRRSFLKGLAGGAALLPAAAVLGESPSPLPAPDEGEAYWEMVRRQFSFHEEKVPMNAANLCPAPRVVADRVVELTHDINVDCSFNNRAKFAEFREESRRKVAQHLGVGAEEIALVRNTSEANNTINNGLPLKEGDEVVLWDQNHPTNNVAWEVRAARFGLTTKRVTTPRHPSSVDELVSVFENALGPRTRVLTISHVSNVTGIRLPVKELSAIAHRRDIHVHVDAAQAWGILNVNLRELGCDSYAASTHKWLVGPKEAGILYVKEDHIPEIWPNVVAPGWGDGIHTNLKGARKFESLGQRDDACLAAVGTTIDFHERIGPSRIEARVYELAGELKAGLEEMGAKLVTPVDPRLSAGVCIVEVPKENRKRVFDALYSDQGIAVAQTGGLRLCPHLYNTQAHIDRALAGVKAHRDLLA
jgi:selenocysteine lyase/cysteine desulfurase